jgi:hypothetical protein
MVHRFGQDFVIVANVLQRGAGGIGLWSEEEGFYFDVIRHGAERFPLKIYSMVGLVPLFAASVKGPAALAQLPLVTQTVADVLDSRRFLKSILTSYVEPGRDGVRMLSVVNRESLVEILRRVLDEAQFLSDYGIRSLSREHRQRPYTFRVGGQHYEVAYLPGVSDSRILGGNSNWRGPVWFPMNFLLIQSLATYSRYYDESFTLEYPTGSGQHLTLAAVADRIAGRLTRIFLQDENGRRAVFGDNDYFQQDVHWRDCIPFFEFFDGETGAGLGASHQTGWTALVALLLQYRGNLCFEQLASSEAARAAESHSRPAANAAAGGSTRR